MSLFRLTENTNIIEESRWIYLWVDSFGAKNESKKVYKSNNAIGKKRKYWIDRGGLDGWMDGLYIVGELITQTSSGSLQITLKSLSLSLC